MSREAWGDPPETERESCPYCGGTHYMTGCDHCDAVKAKCAAEVEVTLLRASLKELVNHWREFGPDHGFDECIERALGRRNLDHKALAAHLPGMAAVEAGMRRLEDGA